MPDEILTPEEILSRRFVSDENSIRIVTGFQRYERPIYDHDVKYAPCRAGCPAGHDIATALFLMAQERPDLAAQVFREESPFPAVTGRVCYHPCESVCNRRDHDEPVAINGLERAMAEYGEAETGEPPPVRYEETVGVIGAGPAGLTCAYHLRRLGYAVTIYDANEQPGGVLQYGIPRYRLPRNVLTDEIESLRKQGLEIRSAVRIGEDLTFDELRRLHDATFVGVGLGRARALAVVDGPSARVKPGIEFLREVSEKQAAPLAGTVAVIGGGDVALDAARCAQRLGATRVMLCCLESRDDMPAHAEETRAALREGIEIVNGVAPDRVKCGRDSIEVTLSRVENVVRQPDGTRTWRPSRGTLEPFSAAHVLVCIGQEPTCDFVPAECWRDGRIAVDSLGRTALPEVFAGGDVVGVYNVVNAVGSAKRAAIGIDSLLRGRDAAEALSAIQVGSDGVYSMSAYQKWRAGVEGLPQPAHEVRIADINLDYFPRAPRPHLPRLQDAHRSQSFIEVNLTLDRQQSFMEARRCFNCGICNMCGNCFLFCPDSSVLQLDGWGFEIDLDHCKGCGVCVEECPRHAMTMVPEHEVSDDGSDERDD